MLDHTEDGTEVIINPGLALELRVRTTVKGGAARRILFDAKQNPAFARLLLEAAAQGSWNDSLKKAALPYLRQLLELGIVIDPEHAPREVRFGDVFNDFSRLREYLPREASSFEAPAASLVLNEALKPSVGVADESILEAEGIWVWIENPGSGVRFPYRLTPAQAEAIAKLRDRTISARELDPEILEFLVRSEILVAPGHAERQKSHWRQAIAKGQRQLAAEKYAVIPGFLTPFQVACLRSHFRSLRAEGNFEVDLEYVIKKRTFMHNEPVSRFVQRQMLAVVSAITGAQLKPSYSFVTTYQPGAVLERHTDREQCAWNISLFIDAEPEVDPAELWPICFDSGFKVAAVKLAMGDAVLYRGTELPHWRDALGDGQHATVLLGHFVASDFEGELE